MSFSPWGLTVKGRETALMLPPEARRAIVKYAQNIPFQTRPALTIDGLTRAYPVGVLTEPPLTWGSPASPAILSHLMGKERTETTSRAWGERGWHTGVGA